MIRAFFIDVKSIENSPWVLKMINEAVGRGSSVLGITAVHVFGRYKVPRLCVYVLFSAYYITTGQYLF